MKLWRSLKGASEMIITLLLLSLLYYKTHCGENKKEQNRVEINHVKIHNWNDKSENSFFQSIGF